MVNALDGLGSGESGEGDSRGLHAMCASFPAQVRMGSGEKLVKDVRLL